MAKKRQDVKKAAKLRKENAKRGDGGRLRVPKGGGGGTKRKGAGFNATLEPAPRGASGGAGTSRGFLPAKPNGSPSLASLSPVTPDIASPPKRARKGKGNALPVSSEPASGMGGDPASVARLAYVSSRLSLAEVSSRFSIPLSTLKKLASRERWTAQRRALENEASGRALDAVREQQAARRLLILKDVQTLIDRAREGLLNKEGGWGVQDLQRLLGIEASLLGTDRSAGGNAGGGGGTRLRATNRSCSIWARGILIELAQETESESESDEVIA